jgi:hypothetical protein
MSFLFVCVLFYIYKKQENDTQYIKIKSCDSVKYVGVRVLELKNSHLLDVVSEVYAQKKYHRDDDIVMLCIYKKLKLVEIKVTVIDKKIFSYVQKRKKQSLWGFYDFHAIPLLVFGDTVRQYFNETGELKTFDWIRDMSSYKGKEEITLFDPTVWLYKSDRCKFVFLRKDVYDIFD